MTREVKVDGKTLMLYKVGGYDNAWCSDPGLARQIQRKRRQFLHELRVGAEEVREVAVKSEWTD